MNIEKLKSVANSVRCLSIDAIQKANSGHPGLPMGCADLGALLYTEILKHDPSNPGWEDRDRFVLSAGHGSMLLYSLLHLTKYGLSIEEIKNFRQLGSLTPGHPEHELTPGVETSTGPLGAGFSNAVGMAIAETILAETFNTDNEKIIDHYTYSLAGDGCLMEGISAEAASLAGHLGLGKLIVFYDSNNITIEGNTSLAFTEDVARRFDAYGWQTLSGDAYDHEGIMDLVKKAKKEVEKPTLITLKSIIGYGSPNKAGSHKVHGAPLGEEEVKNTHENLGAPDKNFCVFPDVDDFIAEKQVEWSKSYDDWKNNFESWSKNNPEKKKLWDVYFSDISIPDIAPDFSGTESMATRKASGATLQKIADLIPNLVGGSADLAPSNNTNLDGYSDYSKTNRAGRNFHFGVREHGMGGIVNGMLLHGGLRTYCATFLVFSDYMRPAIRLAALMKIPQIYVFTHDSIFVGEDGPTHQPIEHVESLRLIPDLLVLRPADAEETVEAWKIALEQKHRPSAIILTRQNLVIHKKNEQWKTNIKKGAYIAYEPDGSPDVVIIASGSEVSLGIKAAQESNKKIRVVSVLSRELFDEQGEQYFKQLIPDGTNVVAVEAGVSSGWKGYANKAFGINRFGLSGPGNKVADALGFNLEELKKLL